MPAEPQPAFSIQPAPPPAEGEPEVVFKPGDIVVHKPCADLHDPPLWVVRKVRTAGVEASTTLAEGTIEVHDFFPCELAHRPEPKGWVEALTAELDRFLIGRQVAGDFEGAVAVRRAIDGLLEPDDEPAPGTHTEPAS